VLVRGDRQKLETLRWSDEFLELAARANFNVLGYGLLPVMLGAELQAQMQRFGKLAGK
jgi:hypothetical protein